MIISSSGFSRTTALRAQRVYSTIKPVRLDMYYASRSTCRRALSYFLQELSSLLLSFKTLPAGACTLLIIAGPTRQFRQLCSLFRCFSNALNGVLSPSHSIWLQKTLFLFMLSIWQLRLFVYFVDEEVLGEVTKMKR